MRFSGRHVFAIAVCGELSSSIFETPCAGHDVHDVDCKARGIQVGIISIGGVAPTDRHAFKVGDVFSRASRAETVDSRKNTLPLKRNG